MLLSRQRIGVIILFLADVVILFLILLLALIIRNLLPLVVPAFPAFSGNSANLWWFFPIWMAIIAYEGAYTKKLTLWDEVKMLWKTTFFATISILTIISLGQLSHSVSRTVILLLGLLSLMVFPPARIAIKRLLVRSGLLTSNVLILGTGETASRVFSALQREPNLGYQVVGFIKAAPTENRKYVHGLKVYGYLNNVERYVRNCDVQNTVIAIDGIAKKDLSQLVDRLQHATRSVLYIPDFSGMAVMGAELVHFFQDQFLAVEIKNNLARPINQFAKRAFDHVVSLIVLILLSIPLLVLAITVKVSSPGPVIFSHGRIGKQGRRFPCYKFRTMYKDAEERLKKILSSDPNARSEWERSWKLKDDPRITRIGRLLRKTSLDELPQLFNVLKGDMSLVGPRPVVKEEIDLHYKNSAALCFSVLPGITGLWQVSGRSDTSYEQRVSLDSWYVRNWNLWLDIVIILKTVTAVFKKEGAR
ncbi:MAG: hypothetical protein A2078_16545 [Nitrospirae bacterium GWC2_57_9]|nr:MAG: hypothetical protein A2078_16545 [Nitrospirae bacterium GWC2_57_9]